MGKPSFPTPSPSGWVGAGAAPARMRAGGPRTPAPARGRGWAGAARAQGHGETGFPHTLAQRVGGSGRRPRADAGRRAAVTIVRRVLPPLPASPRWGEAPGSRPQRGRSNVNIGEPASPYPRPQKGFGGLRPQAGVWGNRVSPPLPEGLGREGDGLSINNPL